MQSLRFLIATAILSVAAASPRHSTWDPTTRDRTAECEDIALYVPADKKCIIFDKCCTHDPLNGDKCAHQEKKCEKIDEDNFVFTCKYWNCTEMITTTTTTTTQSPQQINGALEASLLFCLSALLPHFF